MSTTPPKSRTQEKKLRGEPPREVFKRVGPPGVYHCPHCDEVLSSDPSQYTCPKVAGTC